MSTENPLQIVWEHGFCKSVAKINGVPIGHVKLRGRPDATHAFEVVVYNAAGLRHAATDYATYEQPAQARFHEMVEHALANGTPSDVVTVVTRSAPSPVHREIVECGEKMPEWTADDCKVADGQGWNLFNIDGLGRGEIQRDDDTAQFVSDEDAISFVRRRAAEGDAVAAKALTIAGLIVEPVKQMQVAATAECDSLLIATRADRKILAASLVKRDMPATYSYLDISTAHLTAATVTFLESVAGTNEIQRMVASYEHGFWVSVPPEPGDDTGVPEDLREALAFARMSGCRIVRFDADGEVYDTLPQYELNERIGDSAIRMDWHEGVNGANNEFVAAYLTTKAKFEAGEDSSNGDLFQLVTQPRETTLGLVEKLCNAVNATDPATEHDAMTAAIAFADSLVTDAHSFGLRSALKHAMSIYEIRASKCRPRHRNP
jgi:hypothetical protein